MFFPERYTKPVLLSIVEASDNGWSATCADGTAPGSGGLPCGTGGTAGAKKDNVNGFLYVNPNRSHDLLDPEDVGNGL